MKWRGLAARIKSTEPSVEPESMTMSSQFRYSCACNAGRVSRNAQPSLYERKMMLTKGSFTKKTCRIFGLTQWFEYPSGKHPTFNIQAPEKIQDQSRCLDGWSFSGAWMLNVGGSYSPVTFRTSVSDSEPWRSPHLASSIGTCPESPRCSRVLRSDSCRGTRSFADQPDDSRAWRESGVRPCDWARSTPPLSPEISVRQNSGR